MSHIIVSQSKITKSKCLRLCPICSDDQDFKAQRDKMKSIFVKRGYHRKVVDRAFISVFPGDRSEAMDKRVKNTSDSVPLDFTYHPHNLAIQNILIRNFKSIVFNDEYMASHPGFASYHSIQNG